MGSSVYDKNNISPKGVLHMKKHLHRLFRRLGSVLLAAAFTLTAVFAAAPMPVSAARHPKEYAKMSSSYKSGPYYKKLMAVEMTGNQITDLCAIAASQLGYWESDSKNDLSGTQKGSGNWTEYGNRIGTNGLAWCAAFVTWCIREAEVPGSVFPNTARCKDILSYANTKGAAWHSADSGYRPQPGDLLLYERTDSTYSYYDPAPRDSKGMPSGSSHVGIVVSAYNEKTGTYGVIEGNGGGYVKYLERGLYRLGYDKNRKALNAIAGFITPAYTTGSGSGYDNGSNTPAITVSLTEPTDPAYTAKQKVSATNATVVNRIQKPAGSNITQSGLILSAADGTLIKHHTENVTNVGKSTTVFHSWYDINAELGVTLTPGTTYKYQFFAVIGGKTYEGSVGTFTTSGSAPSYTVSFDAAGGSVSPSSKTVRKGDVYGELPIPTRKDYSFRGWFTAKSGGSMVTSSTNVALSGSQTLYAQWELGNPVEDEEFGPVVPPADSNPVVLRSLNPVDKDGIATITANDPKLLGWVSKPKGSRLGEVEIYIYTPSGNVLSGFRETAGAAFDKDTANDLFVTLNSSGVSKLTPGTVYTYDIRVNVDGKSYLSDRYAFRLQAANGSSGSGSSANGSSASGSSAGAKTYTVSFYDLNTMIYYGETQVTAGQHYKLLPLPTRSSYTATGWYDVNGNKITEETIVNLTKNQVLYVKWQNK